MYDVKPGDVLQIRLNGRWCIKSTIHSMHDAIIARNCVAYNDTPHRIIRPAHVVLTRAQCGKDLMAATYGS